MMFIGAEIFIEPGQTEYQQLVCSNAKKWP
jgi:hypothetical protein